MRRSESDGGDGKDFDDCGAPPGNIPTVLMCEHHTHDVA